MSLLIPILPRWRQMTSEINLTRFSLFFPEKRTFFQERSSIFNFGFEGKSNIFYSRQIGLNKGEQVPILGGGRITGMAGKWDIGFLDLQTQSFDPSDTLQSSLPSENFGVLRLRRQVINRNSYVGGIFTSRLGMDGSYSTSYGVDGIFKILKNDYLNIKLAQVMAAKAPITRFHSIRQDYSLTGKDITIRDWDMILRIHGAERILSREWVSSRGKIIPFMPVVCSTGGYPERTHC